VGIKFINCQQSRAVSRNIRARSTDGPRRILSFVELIDLRNIARQTGSYDTSSSTCSGCPTAMDGESAGVAGAFTCLTGESGEPLVFGNCEAIRHAGNIVGYNARSACLISIVGGGAACEFGGHLFRIGHVTIE